MLNRSKLLMAALACLGLLALAMAATSCRVLTGENAINPVASRPLVATVPRLDRAALPPLQTATLALGCFWGVESRFGSIDGVFRTRVGYAGGTTEEPSYGFIGDYSETVQVDYDPATVSYQKLLEVFWDSHHPELKPNDTEYLSIIFYHDAAQQAAAIASRQLAEEKLGPVYTEIRPFDTFYLAEDYHQKYYLQAEGEIKKDFRAIYPDFPDIVNSTAAARLNGYLGGHGSLEELEARLHDFGLSPPGEERLLEKARWYGSQMTPGDVCGL